MRAVGILVIALIASLPIVWPITVNPQEYRIQQLEPGKPYPVVATLINSDSAAYAVSLQLDLRSAYLADFITFEEQDFQVTPGEKKNIRLVIRADEGKLSPEDHTAVILVMSDKLKLGEFRIKIGVPGERVESLILEDVTLSDAIIGNPIYVILGLRNDGNVIARASPMIEIFEGQKFLERFGEESEIMVMPGTEYNISLMYDPSLLASSEYTLKATMVYGNNINTNTIERSFRLADEAMNDKVIVATGDALAYKVTLADPEGKFYSISYSMPGTGIEGKLEGEYGNAEIELLLGTEALPAGSYDLHIEVSTGTELDSVTKYEVAVAIEDRSIAGYWLTAGLMVIAVICYFGRHLIMELLGIARLKRQQMRLEETKRRFAKSEEDFQKLSHDLTDFITHSNHWLDSRFGRGRYGFK